MDYTYQDAKHLGERCFKERSAKGEDPYLPVLEDLVPGMSSLSVQSLGLQEIPLEQIVGTYSDGRQSAFAANFMPLMGETSEFGCKYQALMKAQLNEGIRDPIKAYEYLHNYYVVEGNKRVSVLKFFNAVSITGTVTRIIPERSEDPEIRAYYEFLDFYRIVPVNYLIFSKPGDYGRFMALAGISREDPPDEILLRRIRSSYDRFRQAYRTVTGSKYKELSESDAFLIFLGIYGFEETAEMPQSGLKKSIEKLRDEFELRTRPETETLKLVSDADAEKKPTILDRLLTSDKVLKAAFLYEKTPDTLSWTYGHELGRQHVNSVFGDRIETVTYENADEENISQLIEEAVSGHADIVFVTSSRFLDTCLKAAVAHQDVKFLCCALNYPHRYLRTFYARTYEAKFVSGVIAGSMAGESDIGYVANCPFLANIINLNAFASGVQLVNPRAKVHAVWTDETGADPSVTFWDKGISIISGRELLAPSEEFHREFGLYRYKEDHSVESLAMTLWNWGVVYQKIIESIRNGSWESVDKKSGRRALNYFWGFASGAIDLLINKNVPAGVARHAQFLVSCIKNGGLTPFDGVFLAENVSLPLSVQSDLVLKGLKGTGWLLDNIEGHIPSADKLRPEVRNLAELQGIQSLSEIGG